MLGFNSTVPQVVGPNQATPFELENSAEKHVARLISIAGLQSAYIQDAIAVMESPGFDFGWQGDQGRTLLDYILHANLSNEEKKYLFSYIAPKMPDLDLLGFCGKSALASILSPSLLPEALRVDLTRILIQAGANPEAVDFQGRTPLYLLASLRLENITTCNELLDLLFQGLECVPNAPLNLPIYGYPLAMALAQRNACFVYAYLKPLLNPIDDQNINYYQYVAHASLRLQQGSLSAQEQRKLHLLSKRVEVLKNEPLFRKEIRPFTLDLAQLSAPYQVPRLLNLALELL